MLAGGLDELRDCDGDLAAAGEGAGIVALAREDSGAPASPRIAAWALAGPGRLDVAVEQALAEADSAPVSEEQTFDEGSFAASGARHWALPSALAFVEASLAIRSGRLSRALVTSGVGDAVSAAVLLEA
jgi:hypothetical protein